MKTIRLYHPHTHEGIAYTPPPEGIELTVNDADAAVLEAWGLTTPPPTLVDTPARATDRAAPTDTHNHTHDDRIVTDAEDIDA